MDLMLDLAGYTDKVDLSQLVVVEPSVGSGAFLGPLVERLAGQFGQRPEPNWSSLSTAVRGFELQEQHVETSRQVVLTELTAAGCPNEIARRLAEMWVRHGDFLLTDHGDLKADLVIGNPPYIRIENLDPRLLAAYRSAAPTMGGRADIFVGFYEHGLDMLKPGGRLAFICADRWMRNSYGKALRRKVVDRFSVDDVIVMHDADAFEADVSAYPAITVLSNRGQGEVISAVATASFDGAAAGELASWRRGKDVRLTTPAVRAARMPSWYETEGVWPDGSPETLAWLERIQETLPPLECAEDGTKLGIGIATGNDKVYVRKAPPPDVEPDRLLPMVTSADIKSGTFQWTGHHLVNPWTPTGPVELGDFPKLAGYYEDSMEALKSRSVAKRSGPRWYRTIDRVNDGLLDRDLLVMEDMKATAHPVRVPAGYYPHHNLYWIVSDAWDLDALGGLLLSEVVERQVAAYCVKMRGGTLRFQATVLRQVRAPRPHDLDQQILDGLAEAFRTRDRAAATAWALQAFGMDALPPG
ncbi:hypothetical protein N802_03630 [Knoellia sinensis KCTC 19936]|uniref:site-specific DNA-methyltransferase (adenine-specific) n=1 Tax=Knoellia sinensis KCTC 19936 TaxID=1385520 RepID=A0A0A0J5X9_9MICO|nr:hypothetical protein N802_03630 [Knoellia sinensis KCTC 19936]